eukprot:gene13065-14410_t
MAASRILKDTPSAQTADITAMPCVMGLLQGNVNFGNNAMVTRFMRGVFCSRHSLPPYTEIWDVSLVLRYIKKWQPLASIDLKTRTLKMVTLMALTCG